MPDNELRVDVNTTGGDQLDRIANSMSNIEKALVKVNPVLSEHEKHLKEVEERAARTSEGIKGFGESIKSHIESPVTSATQTIGTLAASLGPVGVAAATIAATMAAVGSAVFESAKKLGELGTEINNVSIRTGLSTKEVGLFSFAAKAAGSDIGSFEAAMKMLSRGLSENSEEGKKAKTQMAAMGVQARDINGDLRPMSEIFLQLSDGLAKMTGTTDRNSAALALFGRSGLELLPTLLKLRENTELATAAGIELFSPQQIEEMEKYHKEVLLLENAWDKLKHSIMAATVEAFVFFKAGAHGGDAHPGHGFRRGPNGTIELEPPNIGNTNSYALSNFLFPSDTPLQTQVSIGQGSARVDAAIARTSRTPAGLQANLDAANTAETAAYSAFIGAKGSKDSVVQPLEEAWLKAAAAAKKYQDQVDANTAREQNYAASLAFQEKAYSSALSPVARIFAKRDALGKPYYDSNTAAALVEASGVMAKEPAVASEVSVPDGPGRATVGGLNPKEQLEGAKEIARLEKESWTGVLSSLNQWSKNTAKAFVDGVKQTRDDAGAAFERQFKTGQSTASFQATLLGISAKPGEELSAYAQGLQLKMQEAQVEFNIKEAHQEIFDIDKARWALDEENQKLAYDYVLKIADAQRAQLEGDRSAAGSVFDAVIHGGSGVRSLATGFATSTARTIFQNATSGFVGQARNALAGHAGDGPLGKLLAGTAFGEDPVKKNIDALNTNTAALLALAKAQGVDVSAIPGAGGVGSVVSSIAGPGAGSAFAQASPFFKALFGGGGGTVGDIPGGVGAGLPGGPLATLDSRAHVLTRSSFGGGGNLLGTLFTPAGDSVSTGDGSATVNTNAARVGAGVAVAGAVYGGVQGVVSGVKEGGARGTIGAIGAVAGAAAALDPEPISKAILAGVAIASEVVTSLFGDPKQNRAAEITRHLKYNQFLAPVAINESMDTSGNYSDYDRFGNVRSSPFSPRPNVSQGYFDYKHNTVVGGAVNTPFSPPAPPALPVVIQIHTIDAKSFLDHRDDIAAAVAADFSASGIIRNAMSKAYG